MTAHPKKTTKGKGSDEPFTFVTTLLDDDDQPISITVPSLALTKPNGFKLHLLRKEDPSGFLVNDHLLRLSLGDGDEAGDILEILAELSGEEAEQFQTQWREHSGVGLGESRAS